MSTSVLPSRARLDAIDLARGSVMILMLLDHMRDFTHEGGLFTNPLDPATTTVALYLTRWVTHLCAPAFVLLAGLGVGLRGLRGASAGDQARFLITRGLWLILLEVTVVRTLIWWNVDLTLLAHLQVIWAIGLSMVLLSALIWLPAPALLALGLAVVAGHNLLDAVRVPPWNGPSSPLPTAAAKLWMIAHQGGLFPAAGFPGPIVLAQYPVLPWFGILTAGFGLRTVYAWPAPRRRAALLAAAGAALVVFALLRGTNLYGDPRPWVDGPTVTATLMSVFDVQKYPPSLLFSLVTLAPTLALLGLADGCTFDRGPGAAIVTFGRVPLFFYLLQWVAAHVAGIVVTAVRGGDLAPYFMHIIAIFQLPQPPQMGGPLWVTYLCWALGVLLLYWPCRWFAAIKARRREWWLSYL